MLISGKLEDKTKIYNTVTGTITQMGKDAVLDSASQFANIYGDYTFDNTLAGKIIYAADSSGKICLSLYLNYDFSMVYDKGNMVVLYGKNNPIFKGVEYLLFGVDDCGFFIEEGTKEGNRYLTQEFLPEEQILSVSIKDISPRTPKTLYTNPNYIKKIINGSFADKIRSKVMLEVYGLQGV